MLAVHFIKIDACTLGSAVQAFHKSVSHAGQALGWHFVNNTWFGSIFVELQNPECKYVG